MSRTKKLFASAFIVYVCVFHISSCLSLRSGWWRYWHDLASIFALDTRFDMFSPDVPSERFQFVALGECPDGLLMLWTFPPRATDPILHRAADQRFRKLFEERMTDPRYSLLLPDACRFAARQMQKEHGRAPTHIALFQFARHSDPVGPSLVSTGALYQMDIPPGAAP